MNENLIKKIEKIGFVAMEFANPYDEIDRFPEAYEMAFAYGVDWLSANSLPVPSNPGL